MDVKTVQARATHLVIPKLKSRSKPTWTKKIRGEHREHEWQREILQRSVEGRAGRGLEPKELSPQASRCCT